MLKLPSLGRDALRGITASALIAAFESKGMTWQDAVKMAKELTRNKESDPPAINVIWTHNGGCGGNTIAFLDAQAPFRPYDVFTGAYIWLPTDKGREPKLHKLREPTISPLGEVNLVYHPIAMPQDYSAEDVLIRAERGEFDPYVLVIEGTFFDELCVLDLPGSCKKILGPRSPSVLKSREFTPWCSAGYIASEDRYISCNEFVARLMTRAAIVIATGACATYGGVPAEYNGLGEKSPAGEFGTLEDPHRKLPGLIDYASRYMGIDLYAATGSQRIDKFPGPSYYWRSRGYPQGGVKGQRVIAVAGCPPAGDWIMKNLAHAILYLRGIMPEPELDMDQWNRMKYIYGITTHQNCPRGNFYAVGSFARKFGDPECTFTLGCKGIASNSPAPLWGWVGGQGGCTRGGVCIACTAPGFPDLYEPFYSPPKPITPGMGGHVHH